MLYFDSARTASNYLAGRGWKLQGNVFILNSPKDSKTEETFIPADTFAAKTIEYAREMEQIV